MSANPWFVSRAVAVPRLRVYCFSHAGGNAHSYLAWQAGVAPDIEICGVQLPGRGRRLGEEPIAAMAPLLEELADAFAGQAPLPCVFFGHSLGALLAYELVRTLLGRGLPLPLHLFASGCAAPQQRGTPKTRASWSDEQLVEELRKYDGTPPEVLQSRALLSFILPTLRADFSLVDSYRYRHAGALTIPISVLAGRADSLVSDSAAQAWAAETTDFRGVQWFDGGHFFHETHGDAVLQYLNAVLPHIVRQGEATVG